MPLAARMERNPESCIACHSRSGMSFWKQTTGPGSNSRGDSWSVPTSVPEFGLRPSGPATEFLVQDIGNTGNGHRCVSNIEMSNK